VSIAFYFALGLIKAKIALSDLMHFANLLIAISSQHSTLKKNLNSDK